MKNKNSEKDLFDLIDNSFNGYGPIILFWGVPLLLWLMLVATCILGHAFGLW